MNGTEWQVERIFSVTDGDTVRIQRARVEQIGDDWFRLTEVYPDGLPRSTPIRLVWVDTPEKGDHPGWENARADLFAWIDKRRRPVGDSYDYSNLRVVCYESAGWDRMLGDLIDEDGNSASQYLMTEKNWPPYVRGK